jgi:3-oxoacyl-[acyl-carrier protein] reductase
MNRQVALVTGGARGLGLGVSKALAADGWDIAVCGKRSREEAAAGLAEINAAGARVLYVKADIGEDGAPRSILDAVLAEYGTLHLLVNNAGMAPRERKDILEATRESFDELMRVNLRGPYFLTQACARHMAERKKRNPAERAVVVFVTSMSSTVVSVNRGEYCVSKAGLSMAAALWAVRLAEWEIPVYELRPGIMRTDMTAGVKEKYDKMIGEGLTLQKRWGTPEDVGKTVAVLARGELPYSTGAVIMVDGGLTIPRL